MSCSFESVRWHACVHRLDLGLYSHPKEFLQNGDRTHVNSKGKIPSTEKILLRGGTNPRRCIKQDSEPNTLPMSYPPPPPSSSSPTAKPNSASHCVRPTCQAVLSLGVFYRVAIIVLLYFRSNRMTRLGFEPWPPAFQADVLPPDHRFAWQNRNADLLTQICDLWP